MRECNVTFEVDSFSDVCYIFGWEQGVKLVEVKTG